MPSTKKDAKQVVRGFTKGNMRILTAHPTRTALIGALILVALGGGTAMAATSSKPGDLLYGIKQVTEQAQLTLSLTNDAKLTTHVDLAKQRLAEIQSLFAEKNINASGIAEALANFEQHKQTALNLSENTPKAKDVENELSADQADIDKLFGAQQATLESQRESLKQQAEVASKAGNTTLAAQLNMQAATLDSQLKTLEARREESKQQQEKLGEVIKTETDSSSTDNQSSDNQQETVKSQQEALSHAVEQEVEAQNEATKKLQEAQQEAAQKAHEEQQQTTEQESNSTTGSSTDSSSGDTQGH